MELASFLSGVQRDHVENRLRSNLMAWLTTVRPNGQPETVPVWFFVQDDETVVMYTTSGAEKLRNIAANPKVTLVLDVTDVGRDVIRIEGTARVVEGNLAANAVPGYLAKYLERMGALFGSAETFAGLFSVAIVISPAKLRASVPG
jgi:PPOX class probable F420-dependent enzyme